MLSPVYIVHCASDTKSHCGGVGQAIGVGHGAGVVKKLSSHPHFAHLVFRPMIIYFNFELILVLIIELDLKQN